jgi:uncharacterized protein YgiM (DUF1202 family)
MGIIIAASASEAKPQSGQKHRSGFNFQLLSSNGNSITLSSPAGVVYDIKQDVTGTDPTPVQNATNGTVITQGTLVTGKNYYIANPQHANENFSVTLTQSSTEEP